MRAEAVAAAGGLRCHLLEQFSRLSHLELNWSAHLNSHDERELQLQATIDALRAVWPVDVSSWPLAPRWLPVPLPRESRPKIKRKTKTPPSGNRRGRRRE
jgi:hypothetical protein